MLRGSSEEVSEPAEQPGFTICKPKLACPGPLAFWHQDPYRALGLDPSQTGAHGAGASWHPADSLPNRDSVSYRQDMPLRGAGRRVG